MNELQNSKLRDIVDIKSSKRIRMSDYKTEGIPFYRSKEIIQKAAGKGISTEIFISYSQYESLRQKHGAPVEGDLLLTSVGTLGVPYLVKKTDDDFYFKDGNLTWFCNFSPTLDSKYLFYFLKSTKGRQILNKISIGSTQAALTIDGLKSISINLPSITKQKTITQFLETLDKKIELNRKTNETLENIAKTLFKSWFIDFDPVRAKAVGRSTGLPDEISDLFPNSFEESELGEIPKGWCISNIDELLDLEKNSINPIESPEEVFDHYSIPAFDNGHNPTQDIGFSIKSNKFLIPENTFLVCKLNPRFPRVWLPSKESSRRRISSTEFLVCKYKKNVGLPYAYYLTKSFRVTQAMRNMVTGTSSSHQRLRPKDFTSILTIRPNPKLLDCFTDTLFPFLEKSLMIRDQNIILTRYRDTVLPKLISGDLRIPDVEKLIEKVGI